jgi:hypothetical protein
MTDGYITLGIVGGALNVVMLTYYSSQFASTIKINITKVLASWQIVLENI